MVQKLLLLAILLSTTQVKAQEIYLPNIQENATGSSTAGKHLLDVNVALDGTTQNSGSSFTPSSPGGVSLGVRKDSTGPLPGVDDGEYTPFQTDADGNLKVAATLAEVAVAAPGSAVPALLKVAGGSDGTNTQALKTDVNGELQVDVLSSALPTNAAQETTLSSLNAKVVTVDTDDVIVTASALPTGAATEATLSALNGKVVVANTDSVMITSSALPTGAATEATLSALNSKVVVANTDSVMITSSALPTGAATEATLSALNAKVTVANTDSVMITSSVLPTGAASETTLSALNTKLANDFGAESGGVRVNAIPGNASGIADFGAGAATLQTQRVVIANNNSAIAVTTGANENSSFAEDATVGATAETFTAPATAVGYILQASSANVGKIRWKVGGTATASSGHQLEPGRDTGFLPIASDISYINETTTGDYLSVTWVIP